MVRKFFQFSLIQLFLLSAFAVFVIPISAQNGVVKEYYPDGSVKSELTYARDVLDGDAKQYYPNGNLKSEMNFSNGIIHGLIKKYYESGKIKEEYYVKMGVKDGTYKSYYENESLKEVAIFALGVQLRRNTFELDPNSVINITPAVADVKQSLIEQKMAPKPDTPLLQKADEKKVEIAIQNENRNETQGVQTQSDKKNDMSVSIQKENILETINGPRLETAKIGEPVPIGGMKAIQDSLIYPEHALRYGTQGMVTLIATVNAEGEVIDTKVQKGVGFGCSEAAEDAVRKIKFIPVRQDGKNIESSVILNIEFKIPEAKTK